MLSIGIEKRKEILFVLPSLAGGGAERVVVTLLRYLDRRRFKLSLAVVNMVDPVYLPNVPSDVDVIDLRCRRVRNCYLKLLVLIRKRRPDILFSTQGYLNIAIISMKLFLPENIYYVARETSVASKNMYLHKRPWLISSLYRILYKYFDRIICQSQLMSDDLFRVYGIPSNKLTVIPNPIDIDLVTTLSAAENTPQEIKSEYFNLVTAARLSYEKGIDILLEAVRLCGDIPINLLILGMGPLRDEIENKIHSLGIEGRVRLLGFRNNPYTYFARADLFVLSSRVEGFPNVVLEALACGTQVVSTPCAEMLNNLLSVSGNENGWMAAGFSAEDLAESLRCAFRSPRRKPDIQRLDEYYGVKNVVQRYEQILNAGV